MLWLVTKKVLWLGEKYLSMVKLLMGHVMRKFGYEEIDRESDYHGGLIM